MREVRLAQSCCDLHGYLKASPIQARLRIVSITEATSVPVARPPGQPDRPGRGTVGRQLAAGEVGRGRREVARHADFAAISEQIAEVNEKICEARPAAADAPSVPEGEKDSRSRKGEVLTTRQPRAPEHVPRSFPRAPIALGALSGDLLMCPLGGSSTPSCGRKPPR